MGDQERGGSRREAGQMGGEGEKRRKAGPRKERKGTFNRSERGGRDGGRGGRCKVHGQRVRAGEGAPAGQSPRNAVTVTEEKANRKRGRGCAAEWRTQRLRASLPHGGPPAELRETVPRVSSPRSPPWAPPPLLAPSRAYITRSPLKAAPIHKPPPVTAQCIKEQKRRKERKKKEKGSRMNSLRLY